MEVVCQRGKPFCPSCNSFPWQSLTDAILLHHLTRHCCALGSRGSSVQFKGKKSTSAHVWFLLQSTRGLQQSLVVEVFLCYGHRLGEEKAPGRPLEQPSVPEGAAGELFTRAWSDRTRENVFKVTEGRSKLGYRKKVLHGEGNEALAQVS